MCAWQSWMNGPGWPYTSTYIYINHTIYVQTFPRDDCICSLEITGDDYSRHIVKFGAHKDVVVLM